MTPSSLVCKQAMPGLGCGFSEMLGLGISFEIVAIICAILLYRHIKIKLVQKERIFDLNVLFWITMILYLTYRGILSIFPFNYSYSSLLLVHVGINAILALIPISLFVLLVCELLFTYKNPGIQIVSFFRIVFFVFLIVFLIVGVSLSFIDIEDYDPTSTLALWHGCTDFLVVFFVVVPAIQLISAISYPVIQPEDEKCVKWSVAGVGIFCITFLFRSVFNILHYFGVNPVTHWFQNELLIDPNMPTKAARNFQLVFSIVFELGTSIMTMIGVSMIRMHDMKFTNDPFYARAQGGHIVISTKHL